MSEATPVVLVASGSLPPSQPGILRSKSTSDISTTSSELKASTITFAPLPSVEARKRRNSRPPVGIAGRAELLQRSRQQFEQSLADEHNIPPDDDDIPLPDVGKLVKGLWKTVSRMQKKSSSRELSRPPNAATPTVVEGEKEEEGEANVWGEDGTWPSSPDPSSSTTFPRSVHPH